MVAHDIDGCQYRDVKTIAEITPECCPPLLGKAISKAEATALADAFKVLSDPARVQLLSLIAAHAGGECCVCELIEPLDVSQPTVSHHLKVLHQAGLVEREKRGTWVYYKVVPERVAALRSALVPA
ncbi:MAG: ArsR family transcriptional regulator, arsenate/arsenite/antimonite-responsive transcriptional [Actinomycetota bacterium]|jgi:ArsR family transcriptional regulator|nr:ArsR family transcriptional regulator, arsenate/arsenite/antimonite-responsive transcriptional [Actinomycetota bacterium]